MEESAAGGRIWIDPQSISWRVNRESVLLLGGRRALLMQLAHPLVAQAVADHSRFTHDRLGRLLQTLQLSFKIVFGPEKEAVEAIDRINAVHRTVHGVLSEDAGPFVAGTPYSALDPHLLIWVQATLVDSALLFYERFVRPLSHSERERFYLEACRGTEMLGIPPEMLPNGYSAFRLYMDEMIDGGQLTVTETARRLGDEILYPPGRLVPRRLVDSLNIITIGTLPESLRRGYLLRWNRYRAAAFWVATSLLKGIVSMSPRRIRFLPPARAAERRLRDSPQPSRDR